MSKKTDEDSKGEKLASRISQILGRLHQGEALSKQDMVEACGVTMRTIERDLQRLSHLVERKNGRWVLRSAARGTVKSTLLGDYARLVGSDKIFPDSSLSALIAQAEQASIKKTTRIQPQPGMDVRKKKREFDLLDQACQKRHPCRFIYRDKARLVHPYELRHMHGVWYLAGEEGEQLKIFSLERIDDIVVVEDEIFQPKQQHLDYIASQSDVWFTAEVTHVRLRVAAEVAHYFEWRQLLPEQSNDPRDADGSLVVRAKINHVQQLLPVVRYWMPHVRIIEPKAWHDELVEGLKSTLEQWGES